MALTRAYVLNVDSDCVVLLEFQAYRISLSLREGKSYFPFKTKNKTSTIFHLID